MNDPMKEQMDSFKSLYDVLSELSPSQLDSVLTRAEREMVNRRRRQRQELDAYFARAHRRQLGVFAVVLAAMAAFVVWAVS